jgi:hypothetical protein
MNRRGPTFPVVEFDTFSVAVGTALVAGALSILASFLDALTGTLAALALASWVALRSPVTKEWRDFFRAGRGVGLGTLCMGAAIFLLPPYPLASIRGLLLAVTLLPLWWSERRGTPGAAPVEHGS